jgi:hypothetical protein
MIDRSARDLLLLRKRTMISEPSAPELIAYLEEALCEEDMARIEGLLRSSAVWRQALIEIRDAADIGEHSVAMVWRRRRLTCLDREKLWAYSMGGLIGGDEDYARFHLETVRCRWCLSNLADLKSESEGRAAKSTEVDQRRRRFFETSVGHLPAAKRS